MKIVHALCAGTVLVGLLGCGSGEGEADDGTTGVRLKYHAFEDPSTGMVQSRCPIPRDWTVHGPEAPYYITGPDGLAVHHATQQQFAWAPNPFMQQSIRRAGQQLAPPIPLEQIVAQQIRPDAESRGYRFIRSYDVPDAKIRWHRLFAAMPETGSRRDVEALGTEWEQPDGGRALILLTRTATQRPDSMMWQLMTTELESPAEHFADARAAYLYGLANVELNPEWLARSGRAMQQSIEAARTFWNRATETSRQAHQQRMQAIAARGATASSVGDTYSDILDISHQGYLARNNMNNEGQARTVRGIAGATRIGNPATGERYTVDGNSDYYWVSEQGGYIGSDNALFDPRTHKGTRDQDWTRFQKQP